MHCALTWFARAKRAGEDTDARFIFLWIAFSAAYAHEFGDRDNERSQLTSLFMRPVEAEGKGRLHALLFERFSEPIRT